MYIIDRFSLVAVLLVGVLITGTGCGASSTEDKQSLQKIAFGSCVRQNQPQPIWNEIIAQHPDLFILLGDNVYGDTEDMQVLQEKYDQLGAKPGFQKLQASTPILSVWDDHDYGVNDGGANYPKRKASEQVFLNFFEVPDSSKRRQHAGIYGAKMFGAKDRRVQVILLDTRYFRSSLKKWPEGKRQTPGPYQPNTNPEATILGEQQWEWLEQQLEKPAKLRIVASSIQVVPEEHGWEMWANFPHERQRLFDLIQQTQANGVIFLSGDRHLAEISRYDEAGQVYPIYDVTSSGLNSAGANPDEANRHRVSSGNFGEENFGLITVDWNQEDPLINLQIRNVKGTVAREHQLRLSQISSY